MAMATDVALDIGTARTRLATAERGILFDEPTMVAIDTATGEVVDVGHGAIDLIGRTPRHMVVFRPLAQGTTVDFDVTARLIAGLFERAGVSKLSRVRVVMSVPSLATSIERRALRQAAIQAGAREVSLMEAPIAAAIGLGLPVQDPVGSAVTVLGAGASESALISLGGIVSSGARRVGGNDIDNAIATLLRLRQGVVVAPSIIEELKITMSSARSRSHGQSRTIRARAIEDGKIETVEVRAELVNAALADTMSATLRLIQECLADAPPDLSQDVSAQGMVLVGGHAQLTDLAELIAHTTGVTVRVADEPGTVIIRGLQMCLEQMSSLHSLFRQVDR
jgi:rod shape-determining protein MreB